ncbi:hypothetical protein [Candidatus Electronema sp. JC]
MSSDNEPVSPSPKAALDQLKKWQELLAYLAAGIGRRKLAYSALKVK